MHTDIGNTCVPAASIAALRHCLPPLKADKLFEIIRSAGALPNPAWLSYVVTGKARSGIRNALKVQQESESIELGRRLLERALAALNSSLSDIEPNSLSEIVETGKFQAKRICFMRSASATKWPASLRGDSFRVNLLIHR